MGFDIGVTYPLFCLKALSESVKSAEIQDIPISLLSTRERTIEDLAFRRPPATAGHSQLIKLRVISTSHLLIFFNSKMSWLNWGQRMRGKKRPTLCYIFSIFARSSHFSWSVCISKVYFSFHLTINPCFSAPLTAHCPRWTDGKWHPETLILPKLPLNFMLPSSC